MKKKDASNQNRERCFFACEKTDATDVFEFRAKIPALQLAERRFALIQGEKFFSKGFFLVNKVKNISEMEWNSFVSLTVNKENCGEPAKHQRKGKNRTRRTLCCAFCRSYFVFHL